MKILNSGQATTCSSATNGAHPDCSVVNGTYQDCPCRDLIRQGGITQEPAIRQRQFSSKVKALSPIDLAPVKKDALVCDSIPMCQLSCQNLPFNEQASGAHTKALKYNVRTCFGKLPQHKQEHAGFANPWSSCYEDSVCRNTISCGQTGNLQSYSFGRHCRI